MSGTRAISTTWRRELSSSFFILQGKAPKEIHAIPTETLACLLGEERETNKMQLIWCLLSNFSCILLVSLSSPYVHDARSQEPKKLACFLPGRAKDLSAHLYNCNNMSMKEVTNLGQDSCHQSH